MASRRRNQSVPCSTEGCEGRTRNLSGLCRSCRLPRVVRVRHVIEVQHASGYVLVLSDTAARQLADMLHDAVESEA